MKWFLIYAVLIISPILPQKHNCSTNKCYNEWVQKLDAKNKTINNFIGGLIDNCNENSHDFLEIGEDFSKLDSQITLFHNFSKNAKNQTLDLQLKLENLKNKLDKAADSLASLKPEEIDNAAIAKLKNEIDELFSKLITQIGGSDFVKLNQDVDFIKSNSHFDVPKVNKPYFSLALDTENNLDLLESLISKNNETLRGRFKNVLDFPQVLLDLILEIVQNIKNYLMDIKELEKLAHDLNLQANKTLSNERKILKQDMELLKNKLNLANKTLNLLDRIEESNKRIQNLNTTENMNKQQQEKLNQLYEKYNIEKNKTTSETKTLNLQEAELKKRESTLKIKLKKAEEYSKLNLPTLDEIQTEINEMLAKIEKYTQHFQEYCRSIQMSKNYNN